MPRTLRTPQNNFPCEHISRLDAFRRFATHTGGTESAKHIKPLHWYIACRLVLEGGFHPDEIAPRPPFEVVTKGGRNYLYFAPEKAQTREQVVLGGLKTKNVDVVVTLPTLGPVIAISCKGVTKSFRNLTNRMEETIGECTNLHITYAAMVVGYLALIRANKTVDDALDAPDMDDSDPADDSENEAGKSDEVLEPELPKMADAQAVDDLPQAGADEKNLSVRQVQEIQRNDIAITGEIVSENIVRFHDALSQMTLRHGIRDDISRYEAMALALVEPSGENPGNVFDAYPPMESALHPGKFFSTIYQRYEERFVFGAPTLEKLGITRRLKWAKKSPALELIGKAGSKWPELDYDPRLAEK